MSFTAMYQSLKLLSDMAAIRLDEKPDHIDSILRSALMDGTVSVTSSSSGASADPLASSTWEEVLHSNTCVSSDNVVFRIVIFKNL